MELVLVVQGKETGKIKEIFSIDGKTMRGNKNKNQKPNHVVTAYSNKYGICFGQVLVKEKSNEITAIPELIKQVNIKGSLVSIDAMGTQIEIADQIIQKKGDYLLPERQSRHITQSGS